jgi:hypothetical protein
MMAMSASPYDVATFWAAVGAVATVVVPIILWRLSNRRRVLLYSTPVVTSLLSAHPPHSADGDIQVTFKGQPLTDPHLVTFRLENISGKDFLNKDFNADKPLVIMLGTPFAALISEPTEMPCDKIVIENAKVSIGPCFLKKGFVLLLEFITEGPPHVSYRSEIDGTDLYPDQDEKLERQIGQVLRYATWVLVGCLIIFVPLSAAFPKSGFIGSALAIIIVVLIAVCALRLIRRISSTAQHLVGILSARRSGKR